MAPIDMRRLNSLPFRRTLLLFTFLFTITFLVMYSKTARRPTLKEGVEELGQLCSKLNGDCYTVKQQIGRDRNIIRFLESQKYSQNGRYSITILPMRIDSSGNIVVDRKTLFSQYIAAMVTFPYMVDSLSVHQPSKILSIGLGGGSLDMFYHENQPELDVTVVELDETMATVARKWFGVVEDDRRRTVIGDGTDYLKETTESGEKYDVIALDACDSGNPIYRCPAPVFYGADSMKSVYEALTQQGAFVINVITTNVSAITSAVKQQFPTCFLAQMTRNSNQVIGCVKHKMERAPNVLIVKFGIAMAKLGLDKVIGDVVFQQI
ncbi:hypothetical protein QR680_019000 [Steinernema hermaphroditum]|uniref:PABS domain-containing protein n=1 Tax=Steinernema hermaphroditum TaxID=289476 RepID=A0AA39HJP1_9BILA|nr:hypothetical protein QR680_019000 [Steinernema hermaphroditum]